MALEDAFILSNLIGSIHSSSDLESAFKAYDAIRRPRTQDLVTTSKEAGEVVEFEGKDIGDDIEKLKANLDVRFDWIWDEDLDQELKDARRLLGE